MRHLELQARLASVGYIADEGLAMALSLAMTLERSLLLEGQAGVGKTEIAKALARVQETDLIRLQCYEGLDANAAIYEWNYQRQLLAIKVREGAGFLFAKDVRMLKLPIRSLIDSKFSRLRSRKASADATLLSCLESTASSNSASALPNGFLAFSLISNDLLKLALASSCSFLLARALPFPSQAAANLFWSPTD